MSRRHRAEKREVLPDPKFGDVTLAKFINVVMLDGKKTTAQKVVYDALDILGKRVKDQEPLDTFMTALNNVKPILEVRSKRVGGATYQVPMEISRKRQQALAIRVIVTNTRSRKGKPMAQCLADELHDAFQNQGASVQWRDNTAHRSSNPFRRRLLHASHEIARSNALDLARAGG